MDSRVRSSENTSTGASKNPSAPDLGQRFEMMYVDEAFTNLAVDAREVEAAHTTVVAVVVDAALGCFTAAFVGIHGDPLGGTLGVRLYSRDFLRRLVKSASNLTST